MHLARRVARAAGVGALAVMLSAHVGSPDVFFNGRAGPYVLRVIVRPPEVVPGIARVVVRAPATVTRVSIRPVYWRAGSRGAPTPDETRRMEGAPGEGAFEGSLWLMQRGAYSVDVVVEGASGPAHVLVPVASVATGRLALGPGLGALLILLGCLLLAGLINIVYKGAGESLVAPGGVLDAARARRARRVAAVTVPILALAVLGGARWWGAVDRDYSRRMYRPSPLALSLAGDVLELRTTDTVWSANGRPLGFVPDHGKPMHLFLVRRGDARAFAHLHPRARDSSAVPTFETRVPALPGGTYHVFADVVDETGFERTLVGTLALPDSAALTRAGRVDPDDAWFVGDATREGVARFSDGSTMRLSITPDGLLRARRDETLRVTVEDSTGHPVTLEPYLGMSAHAVMVRVDGEVYVHLHPMGTVSVAAQQAFLARDRGDTTADGRLRLAPDTMMHDEHSAVEFPYAFPRGGSYRLFVQVKRHGRVLTGAFALPVAEAAQR